MRLSLLILSLCWQHAFADDVSLTRRADGDVFTIPGSCNEACMVLSDDTASPFGPTSEAISSSCTCQCNNGMPVYREDLRICVEHIQECNAAGFVGSSGLVERVPYVFLPQYGQIIYPQAEIKFEGAVYPVCVVTGVQQLDRGGWSELRNISDVVFPLSLYRDEERTFLQWTGDAKLRETAEGKIVVVKLACRDSYPTTAYRKVFTSCVAFRVAGSPSKISIKEVSFAQNGSNPQGLTSAEYTAIGLASVLLALIYMASVSLYLHVRRSRRKGSAQDELEAGPKLPAQPSMPPPPPPPPPRHVEAESAGIVKCNPLLQVARHFESDSNSAASDADLADKLLHSESESDVENVNLNITSAVIHPHQDFSEPQEQSCNTGTIVGERLPEEDVRVVETTDSGSHHHVPVFPGIQRRKLYFNPAYFERQLLLAPPPAATEFLHKIREVISIAKHKMSAKRFVPSLNEIPEETPSERPSSAGSRPMRRRAGSMQRLSAPTQPPPPPPPQRMGSTRRSLRCAGCPGCGHGSSTPNLPAAAAASAAQISGESRVRAWLEDVKLLDATSRPACGLDDERPGRGVHHHHLGAAKHRDVDTESSRLSIKSMPTLFGDISHPRLLSINGCVNESFEGDLEAPRQTARSVTHEPGHLDGLVGVDADWARRRVREQHAEIAANAEVRRAIESSFKRQLEQLRAAGDEVAARRPADERTRSTTEEPPKLQVAPANNNKSNGTSQKKEKEPEPRAKLNAINKVSVQSNSDAKRIMDAVIKELVVAKEKESEIKSSSYETDSLDRSKVSRKLSSSPDSTSKSSPTQSSASALPMAEELTMRNEIIDVQISETLSTKNSTIVKKHNLPEIVPLRPDNYALVSEVYVNNGYASPNGSDDDSGPEIQYEPENPGHLTIKVVDSPTNYEKQVESEYEPDTLDRKPMKLKINGDIPFEKNLGDEVYSDSLERSSQILLRSKRSFREDNEKEDSVKPPREYNSLREIYEARLKYQQQQQQQEQQRQQQKQQQNQQQPKQENEKAKPPREIESNGTDTWYTKNYKSVNAALPPVPRHERRQRKADNQPDVVPKPPPPPPPDAEPADQFAKNAQDRSPAEADDPTNCEDAPVAKEPAHVVGKPPAISRKPQLAGGLSGSTRVLVSQESQSFNIAGPEEAEPSDLAHSRTLAATELVNLEDERRSERRQQYQRFTTWRSSMGSERGRRSKSQDKGGQQSLSRSHSCSNSRRGSVDSSAKQQALEDSAYVSSPDSGGSRRQLLPLQGTCARRAEAAGSCSGTESDESSSRANSESGGESVETDSVFFACQRQSREQHRPLDYQRFQIEPGVY